MCSLLLGFLILFVFFDILHDSCVYWHIEKKAAKAQICCSASLAFASERHCPSELACISTNQTYFNHSSFQRSAFSTSNHSRDGRFSGGLPVEMPVLLQAEQENTRAMSLVSRSLEHGPKAQYRAQDPGILRIRMERLGELDRGVERFSKQMVGKSRFTMFFQ